MKNKYLDIATYTFAVASMGSAFIHLITDKKIYGFTFLCLSEFFLHFYLLNSSNKKFKKKYFLFFLAFICTIIGVLEIIVHI